MANVGLRRLETRGFKPVEYVDDAVILVCGRSSSTLWEEMEYALGILSSWATNCDLGINSNTIDFVCSRVSTKLKLSGCES